MTAAVLPLAEVTRRAIAVLSRELGPADTIRFLGQYTTGAGDYTADRDRLFAGQSLADVVAAIEARRPASPPEPGPGPPPTSTSGPSA